MFTSQYARTLTTPVNVSINDIRKNIKPENFAQPFIPIGYLLEGNFTSLFKNRFVPEGVETTTIVTESKSTKMVVIADGDLARNEINPRTGKAMPLGFDPFSNYTFANEELLMNAVGWLLNDGGLLTARTKEVKMRPLDKERVQAERLQWQLINLVLPLVLIAIFGVVWAYARKKKFANF